MTKFEAHCGQVYENISGGDSIILKGDWIRQKPDCTYETCEQWRGSMGFALDDYYPNDDCIFILEEF